MNDEQETYDLEAVYDEQISPLMDQIIAICREHNLPMIASFAYSNDEERGSGVCTTALPFEGRTPDRFHVARGIICNGLPDILSALILTETVKAA